MVGQTISHYTVIEKLGQGGMGVVYKARDTKLDRFVALKFLPQYIDTNEEQKKRFINEAKTASAIDHPNIGAIYEIDETNDGQMFIAMAYYDGDTLKKIIEKELLSIDCILNYAIQIAQGLSKAHEHNIIHRDLKPANIIITKDNIVKIIDFGLAKLKGGQQLTKTGFSLGTIAYMSPEQLQCETIDIGTDIWALGVMMYEMLTGKLPFQGEYEAAMLYKIVNEEPEPLHNLRSDIPADLEKIVYKAINKDCKLRYQSIDEMLQELISLKKDLEYGVDNLFSRKSLTKRSLTVFSKPKDLIVYSISIAVLAIIVFFLFRFISQSSNWTEADKSIAVLPFSNIKNPELEYLTNGLTRDIIKQISYFPNITVVSKTTSFLFKNSALSDSAIAVALGVRFILNGNFQLVGSTVSQQYYLYDKEKNKKVIERSIEKSRGDILEIINDISQAIGEYFGYDYNESIKFKSTTTISAYEAYLQGIYHLEKNKEGDNSLAIEYFSDAIKKDTLFANGFAALAQAQVIRYENDWKCDGSILISAENNCKIALQIDSNNTIALETIGDIANMMGNKNKALQLYMKVLEIDKQNADALTKLAALHIFNLNEPAKGIVYLKRLQEVNPTDWLNNSNVGVGYAQLKQYDDAVEWFRRSIKFNPNYDASWNNLGYVLERIGKIDSAEICYRTALLKNPLNAQYYENLICILIATKNYSSAESILVEGLKRLPNNHKLVYGLGVIYTLMGKIALAKQTFQDGLRLIEGKLKNNLYSSSYYADMGLFHARLGNSTKAFDCIHKAIRIDSTNNEILIKAARVNALLKEKNKMLLYFKRAKELNPEYDNAYLTTALDFENYRNDPDLLFLAR